MKRIGFIWPHKVDNRIFQNEGLQKGLNHAALQKGDLEHCAPCQWTDICLRTTSVKEVVYSAYYARECFLLDENFSMGIISIFIAGNARCLVGWLQIDNVNTRALYTE